MQFFARIFYAALIAGIVAGVSTTGVQALRAVPLIHAAETYEQGAAGHHEAANHHEPAEDAWSPSEGLERTAYTAVANVLAGIGFALLLTGAYALRGGAVGWRQGLLWGLAGFATFVFAPSLGLPPELPGSEAAPLLERQAWWVTTAVATGAGLWLVAFARPRLWKLAGLALIAVPHLIGAPGKGLEPGAVPLAMAREFVYVSLAGGLLFWVLLGVTSSFAFARLVRDA